MTTLHSPNVTPIPIAEINHRWSHLQKVFQKKGIDGALIVQRVDLLYFSGTAQDGALYVPCDGEPVLFIKRYFPRARKESPLNQIVPIDSFRDIPGCLMDHYSALPRTLGLEFDVMPVAEFQLFQKGFPSQKFVNASTSILDVRKTKSPWDIQQMERTAEMSSLTFDYMRRVLTPGLSEMEFAGLFENFARNRGHAGKLRVRNYRTEGYSWHVLSGRSGGMTGVLDSPASGEGSSYAFPCGAGNKKISAEEPIMVDFASVLNGFHMDETRMFAIGRMPTKALGAAQAAIAIHQELLNTIKPGMCAHDIFSRALDIAGSLGYKESYLGIPGHQVSFIGHGIGYELIEPPIIAQAKEDLLLPGMIFALEPKFVFADEFSAGIESVFLVTDTGARLISKTPVEIFIC
ncbi:MAG: aminopeptidase P family protein [Deltaproteobacteria bacterium]|nr:MAG: aminopeptidase P family protein [Deltaproteobacteria bacterium]RLC17015.1 MAG: aminopeptidase P family protein [Deltaproteobacteria bacterium]